MEALSFFFLFQFGVAALSLLRPVKFLNFLPVCGLAIWLAVYLHSQSTSTAEQIKLHSNLADLWARYLLCFPGAGLSALALWLHARQANTLDLRQVQPHLIGAACAFLLYAFVAGLLVPPADFFPASWLNRRLLSAYLGLPAPIARALAGLSIAYFMIRSLKIFEIEMSQRLAQARRDLTLLEERERIGRELHDGVLQQLYGAGLQLESALPFIPAEAAQARGRVRQAVDSLVWTMAEIRSAIFDLSGNDSLDFEARARELVRTVNRSGALAARLVVLGTRNGGTDRGIERQFFYFLQEAVANAQKHARAKSVTVQIAYLDAAMTLAVSDDGSGFIMNKDEESPNGEGRGLRNMRRRAELLDGNLEVRTAPGSGTKVILSAPYRKH